MRTPLFKRGTDDPYDPRRGAIVLQIALGRAFIHELEVYGFVLKENTYISMDIFLNSREKKLNHIRQKTSRVNVN